MYDIAIKISAESRQAIAEVRRLRQELSQLGFSRGGGGGAGGFGFDRATRETMQWSRALRDAGQAFRRTFTGESGILNITSRLFSSLGMATRGFGELGRAARTFIGGVSLNPVKMLGSTIEATGQAASGFLQILGGATSQIFRLAGLPFKILGAFGSLVPKLGSIFGAVGNLAGGAFSFVGDSLGELMHVSGRVLSGLGSLVSTALKPIAGLVDVALSPITTAIGLVKRVWDYSLIGMVAGATWFTKSAISQFQIAERAIAEAISQMPEATGASFGIVKQQAMEMSKAIGKPVEDAAKAIRLVSSVGFTGLKESTDVATAGLKLSIAGFSSVEASVESVTNVLRSYNLAGTESARVADVLHRGFQVGGGSAEMFSRGLGRISAQAAASGVPLEQLVSAVSLLTQASSGNASVFAEMSQLITKIIAPTAGASEAFQAMGISIKRTSAGGVDLFGSLDNIGKRVRQLSGGDIVKSTRLMRMLIPEERASRSAAKMFMAAGDSIKAVRAAVGNSAGAVDAGVGLVDDRSFRQVEKMQSSLGRLRVTFGGLFAGAVASGAQKLASVFDRMQAAIDDLVASNGFDRLKASAAGLVDAFGIKIPTDGIGGFIDRLIRQNIPDWMDSAATSVRKFRDAIGEIKFPSSFEEAMGMAKSVWADLQDYASQFIMRLTGSDLPTWMSSIQDSAASIAKSLREALDAFNQLRGARTPARQITPPVQPHQQDDALGRAMGVTLPTTYGDTIDFYRNWWDVATRKGTSHMGLKNYRTRPPMRPEDAVPHMQAGGVVPGFGNGDTVPIMAEPGEVVLSRKDILAARRQAFGDTMAMRRQSFTDSRTSRRDRYQAMHPAIPFSGLDSLRERRRSAGSMSFGYSHEGDTTPQSVMDAVGRQRQREMTPASFGEGVGRQRGRENDIQNEQRRRIFQIQYRQEQQYQDRGPGIFKADSGAASAVRDLSSSAASTAASAMSSVSAMLAETKRNLEALQAALSKMNGDVATLKGVA
jgi:TP901 family phage tail tape measure protein